MSPVPVTIHTDGAASGNPGPGGYGIVMQYGQYRKEISKGFRLTTNNRMELMAVVDALKELKRRDLEIVIYTDSRYVADPVEKGWLRVWIKKGFRNKKNTDLWREYLQVSNGLKLRFIWLKGHAGHPENERCDQLAVRASMNPAHIDQPYENGING